MTHVVSLTLFRNFVGTCKNKNTALEQQCCKSGLCKTQRVSDPHANNITGTITAHMAYTSSQTPNPLILIASIARNIAELPTDGANDNSSLKQKSNAN